MSSHKYMHCNRESINILIACSVISERIICTALVGVH